MHQTDYDVHPSILMKTLFHFIIGLIQLKTMQAYYIQKQMYQAYQTL